MKESIFPIVTYNPTRKEWKCLGTGYFINPVGAFVTAKHLFVDSDNKTKQTLYGIQYISENEQHIRPVNNYPIVHPNADIMIGTLGKRRIIKESVQPNISKYFAVDFNQLNVGDKISTFAYPKTIRNVLNAKDTEFTFKSSYSEGEVIEYLKDGAYLVRNRCYHTTLQIDSGASGGPVLKNGYIVGVNSSSFDLEDGEEPISYITPIDYILDLKVIENGNEIPVKDLVKNGYIKTEKTLHNV